MFVILPRMTTEAIRWRLIVDGDLPGALNMARDVAILEAVSDGESPPTLRLYGWNPPCLTLGRHQGVEAADLEFCSTEGIDVVRRPTGGRALLHHLELTYALVAPFGTGPLPSGLQDAYRSICVCMYEKKRRGITTHVGHRGYLLPQLFRHAPGPTSLRLAIGRAPRICLLLIARRVRSLLSHPRSTRHLWASFWAEQ